MKSYNFLLIGMAVALLSACNSKTNGHDASGVFETTEVVVSAQGSGQIIQFDVEEGQTVEANSPLGVIDTTQLHLKKEQLQAGIRAMTSHKVTVGRQIAVLKEQITKQKTEQKRFETLVKENAANQKTVDDITASILTLEKQLDAQTEMLNNANNGIDNEHESMLIQVKQINDMIKNSIIQSPIDGVVLGKFAETGELAAPGRALFKVADTDNMFLRAYISSSQLTQIKMGQTVKVYSDMGESESKEYNGTVSWISDKAEFTPKTIQTRDERANLVYAVKIAVKNDGYIKKGMYGEISFK